MNKQSRQGVGQGRSMEVERDARAGHAEIMKRARSVRQANLEARRKGFIRASAAELTAVLGDERGMSAETLHRESVARRRKKGSAQRPSGGSSSAI